jgi:hypothetical protein
MVIVLPAVGPASVVEPNLKVPDTVKPEFMVCGVAYSDKMNLELRTPGSGIVMFLLANGATQFNVVVNPVPKTS